MRSLPIRMLACTALVATAAAAQAGSLDLGTHATGPSFGDAPRWTGIRINTVDRSVERVTGLNLTL